jgi:hypothetical protein
MRTCDYSDVLRASAALAGFTTDEIGTPEFQLFRTFHDRRLQIAWEIHRWPEICPLEQRTFRAKYDETGETTYPVGAEVLDPGTQQYYQALVQSTGQPPTINGVENSAYWAICQTSYTADPYDSTVQYAIGDQVQDMTDLNFYQLYAFTLAVTVAGAGIAAFNGLYLYNGIAGGKPTYMMNNYLLAWYASVPFSGWLAVDNNGQIRYASASNVATPDLATGWFSTDNTFVPNSTNNPAPTTSSTYIVPAGNPSQNLANWGLLTVFERNIAWNQPWADQQIGEFMVAYDKDPRVTTKLVKLPFVLDQDGAQFVQLRNTFNYGWNPASTNFSYVWLYYRLQRPILSGDVLDLTVSYPAGAQVYYKSTVTGLGNFYTATGGYGPGYTPDNTPAAWTLVQIPYTFRQYLIEGGYADWLASDGQLDKANSREEMAMAALEMEADKLQRQQQQVNRFDWRNNY